MKQPFRSSGGLTTLLLLLLVNTIAFGQEKANWDTASWIQVMEQHDLTALSRMLNSTNAVDQVGAALAINQYATNLPASMTSQFISRLRGTIKSNYSDLTSWPDHQKLVSASELKHPSPSATFVELGIESLGALGSRATNSLDLLLHILRDPHVAERFRITSFRAISKIAPNSHADTKAMNLCLHSDSDVLFEAAVDRLYNFPRYQYATNFIPLMVGALPQPHRKQWQIITSLGFIGGDSPMAISAVRHKLTSNDAANRASAIHALYNMNAVSRSDIARFGKLLTDGDQAVRLAAVRTLSLAGTNAIFVLPELRRAMVDKNPEVAEDAGIAFGVISNLSYEMGR